MAEKTWQPIKVTFCHHVGEEVSFEAELIYPADFLPDPYPRVVAHRCSRAVACNLEGKASCIWAGTNPVFDPFLEKMSKD